MGSWLELHTSSARETRAVAAAVARLLSPGDVVSLTGDLGAGKTTFVQGAAAELGVTEPVLSPTFTLVREYKGPRPISHLDVYRLDRLQDVVDLGFEEMLDRGATLFIEWGDAIEALLPESFLQVELSLPNEGGDEGTGDEARRLAIEGHGPAWEPRRERLEAVTRQWTA
jgi:tRNA threonylcarbamoyladenosine biosynthesis protein TsaE